MARAPVYRYLDAKNALFGLSLGEALALLTVAWPALLGLPPPLAAAAVVAAYASLRLAGRGRADGFAQHWVAWHLRRLRSGGYLSPSARSAVPRFPFAEYLHRDAAPRGRR